jgi:histone acetyltransferase (RNA polymerase elongator complex component)
MKNAGVRKRFIIPIFITHQGCPHRCVFCNQEEITNWRAGIPSTTQIQTRIVSYLGTVQRFHQRREVAFYGGSFTALPAKDQKVLLAGVQPFINENKIDAIRVSTRPDAIEADRLQLLRDFNVETVEVGAQSLVEEILANSHRGHTARDVVESVRLVRSMGFEVGLQIMVGLPGEDRDLFLTTVRRVIELGPDFVRIYPLLVLKGSPLEKLHRKGLYTPISLREAVEWVKVAQGLLELAKIAVVRVGLQTTPELDSSKAILAGPYHPAFRFLVESALFYDMACRLLENSGSLVDHRVRFRVAPEDLSNLNGHRKDNLARLRKAFGLKSIEIVADSAIARGKLLLEGSNGFLAMSREQLMA